MLMLRLPEGEGLNVGHWDVNQQFGLMYFNQVGIFSEQDQKLITIGRHLVAKKEKKKMKRSAILITNCIPPSTCSDWDAVCVEAHGQLSKLLLENNNKVISLQEANCSGFSSDGTWFCTDSWVYDWLIWQLKNHARDFEQWMIAPFWKGRLMKRQDKWIFRSPGGKLSWYINRGNSVHSKFSENSCKAVANDCLYML